MQAPGAGSPLAIDDPSEALMKLSWNKAHRAEATAPTMTHSEAARPGPEGDGKDHDLQYWLESGFLALPKEPGRTGM